MLRHTSQAVRHPHSKKTRWTTAPPRKVQRLPAHTLDGEPHRAGRTSLDLQSGICRLQPADEQHGLPLAFLVVDELDGRSASNPEEEDECGHDDDADPLEAMLVLELGPQEAGDRGLLSRVVHDRGLDIAQLRAGFRLWEVNRAKGSMKRIMSTPHGPAAHEVRI